MVPISLTLRGAIGIHLGMGLDEITLDFTQFKDGIIAFVADNGTGKSTVMEMMHPYLTLASRSGKLQDHFRLRDSKKEFTCTQNGLLFRTQVLIDAQSGKAEAYIFQGDEKDPLNDGKITSYEEKVEQIFGSAEMFFNSKFSAQRGKSIIALKPSERKKIFYDFLGETLERFEKLDKIAKKMLDDENLSREKILGKIETLKTQLANFGTGDQNNIEIALLASLIQTAVDNEKHHREELTGIEREINSLTFKLENIAAEEQRVKQLETKLGDLKGQIVTVTTQATNKEQEFLAKQTELNADISRKERILANKITIDNALTEIQRLEAYLNITVPKLKGERAVIQGKINQKQSAYQAEINSYDLKVKEYQIQQTKELADLKTAYNEIYFEYQRLELERQKELTHIGEDYHKKIDKCEKEYAEDYRQYEAEERNVAELGKQVKVYDKDLEMTETNFKILVGSKERELEETKKNASLIDTVPCSTQPDLNNTCLLLSSARKEKERIPEIEKHIENLKKDFNSGIAEIEKEKSEVIAKYEAAKAKLVKPDEAQHLKEIKQLEDERANDLSSVLPPAKPDYQVLEANKAKVFNKFVDIINAVIKPKPVDVLDETLETARIEDELKPEGENSKKLQSMKAQEWESIKKEYDTTSVVLPEKKKALLEIEDQERERKTVFVATSKQLQKDVDDTLGQLSLSRASADKSGLLSEISTKETQKKSKLQEIETEVQNQTTDRAEKQKREEGEKQRVKFENELKTVKDTELQKADRKIERLTFIREALSKNGIPALIIDVAGVEITKIANKLLSDTFNTNFAITFETTKLTKEGNTVETFDIQVERQNFGQVKIENLSGGEQVWVDQAITNAFGIYADRKSSREGLTVFGDEKDGQLSPDKKQAFLRLSQETFKEGNRNYMFIVTHSAEVWKQIPQRIHLFPTGKVEIVN